MKKRYLWLLLILIMAVFSGCSKRVTKETEDITYGIDVARYQGTVNWTEVADSGVDFAMIRLGYRGASDGVIKEDANGRYNLQEASKAGVAIGAYFFSTATTKEEAVEEAKWVAAILDGYPITYPVAYDCEGFEDPESRQYSMTKTERTDVALAFLKTIERLGYEGMFYASKNMLEANAKWETTRIAGKYKIWVAQYPELPYPVTECSTYSQEHHMWQYSMEGKVPGIRANVDLNIAYFGYDGIEPPKGKEPTETYGPDVEAMMDFTQVSEMVTAKNETNLRSIPSQEEPSQVLYTLKRGEIAQRIAVSYSGWSKLIFQGETYYAVTNYLTTDINGTGEENRDTDGDGIQTVFHPVDEQVTAKELVNLRLLPSTEHEGAEIIGQLKHGEAAHRVGVSDNGWSKLIWNETTCYAVTNYLMTVEENGQTPETEPAATDSDGQPQIKTTFTEVNDRVTAKLKVNLRNIPSVDHPDSKVIATIVNGDVVTRTGINEELGWSRVEYEGQTLYCVSRYLMGAK